MTESVIIEEELPPDAAEMYQRLLFLREEYRRQTQAVLGISLDSTTDKKGKKEKDDNDKPFLGKKVGSDDYQIRAITKSVIESHGGSSHIETIVEYVHMRLPNLRKKDGSAFSALDCKKHVQSNLRTDLNSGKPCFQKDSKQFGCWTLVEDENKDSKISVDPLFVFLSQVIDNSPTKSCKIKVLTDQVLKNWLPKMQGKGIELTGEQTREAVRIILETNPRFKKDSETHVYTHVPQKRRRVLTKNGEPTPSSKKRKVDSDSDEETPSLPKNPTTQNSKTQKSSKLVFVTPAVGVVCKCGEKATKTSLKWRKTSNGSLVCPNCSLNTHPTANQMNNHHHHQNKKKEVEDTNPWIRCDACHRWVRAKSDNIDDISLYDDSNPNHLDYYCPRCRKKREEAEKNPPSRHSKRTRRTSNNSAMSSAPTTPTLPGELAPSSSPSVATKNEITNGNRKPSKNEKKKRPRNGKEPKSERDHTSKSQPEDDEYCEDEEEESSRRKPKKSSRSQSSSPDVKSQKDSEEEEEEEDGEIHSDESGNQSPDELFGSNGNTNHGDTKPKSSKKELKKGEAENDEMENEDENEEEDDRENESDKDSISSPENNTSNDGFHNGNGNQESGSNSLE